MHYVKQFDINGVATKQVACIELHGKPNAATEGHVGVLGIDVDSPYHDVYKCSALKGGIYTWELLSSGLSIMTASISGAREESVEFPYDTLKVPNDYLVKIGDLIIDSETHLYQIAALGSESCVATYTGVNLGYSPNANHAITADRATDADHATSADQADKANHATLADNAVSVPAWNVDSNVGAISPAVDMKKMDTNIDKALSQQISFPMINSGNLYLDFNIDLTMDRDSAVTYNNIVGKVDIYLNDELVKTCGGTYTEAHFNPMNGKGSLSTEHRNLLSVQMGDVVTLIVTFSRGSGSVYDHFTMQVTGVQLKANIITAHTYLNLVEDLESPTADEILDIILGEE